MASKLKLTLSSHAEWGGQASEVTSETAFRRYGVAFLAGGPFTEGGSVVFFGIDLEGRHVAEHVRRGAEGALEREVESPPRDMAYHPSCRCGHARLSHDEWGNTACCEQGCRCAVYEADDGSEARTG